MMPVSIREIDDFEIVLVDERPYMFTHARIKRESLPEDLLAYDVMDDGCNGEFCLVQEHVLINHWGTIIGQDQLLLGGGPVRDAYVPDTKEKGDGNFIGLSVASPEEFVARYEEFLKEV